MKIDTSEKVLNWAASLEFSPLFPDGKKWEVEVAEKLAKGQRVLEAYEKWKNTKYAVDTYPLKVIEDLLTCLHEAYNENV